MAYRLPCIFSGLVSFSASAFTLVSDGSPPIWTPIQVLDCEGPGFDPLWGFFRERMRQCTKEGTLWEDLELVMLAEELTNPLDLNDRSFTHDGILRWEHALSGVNDGSDDEQKQVFCLFGVVAALFLRGQWLWRHQQNEGVSFELTRYGAMLLGISKGGRDFLEDSSWPIRSAHLIEFVQTQEQLKQEGVEVLPRWLPVDLLPSPGLHSAILARGSAGSEPPETSGRTCDLTCGSEQLMLGHTAVRRMFVDSAGNLSFVDTSLCSGSSGFLRRLRLYTGASSENSRPGLDGVTLQRWRQVKLGEGDALPTPAFMLLDEQKLAAPRVGFQEFELRRTMYVEAGDCIGWSYSKSVRGPITYAESDNGPLVLCHHGRTHVGQWQPFESVARRLYSLSLTLEVPMCMPRPTSPFAIFPPGDVSQRLRSLSHREAGREIVFIAALGDHVTGTLEPASMIRKVLADSGIRSEIRFFGHPCPVDERASYQCALRCELLGQCGSDDAVTRWLEQVLNYDDFSSRHVTWDALEVSFAAAAWSEAFLREDAELFVCGHPVVQCIALASALAAPSATAKHDHSDRPLLAYLQSTLLYGAPGCERCQRDGHTLGFFESEESLRYLYRFRELSARPSVSLLTNCPFASAQIWYQTGVVATSVPNQALYVTARWSGLDSERLILARSSFYDTQMGRLFASMLEGMIVMHELPLSIDVLTRSSELMSHDEMSARRAALLMPHDLGIHAFNALYRMGVPIWIPAQSWAPRMHRAMPWGWTAYGGALPDDVRAPLSDSAEDSAALGGPPLACIRSQFPFSPWLDVDSSDAEISFWYEYSNAATFEHVQRFESVTGFLASLHALDLSDLSAKMLRTSEALLVVASRHYGGALARLLAPG